MNLLDAMNCEYLLSKRWLLATIILTGVFSVCSLVGSLGSSKLSRWLAVITFIIQVLIVLSRRRSDTHYQLSEVVRRPAMLLAGLGRQPSDIETREIAARLGVSGQENRIDAETYYASKSPSGPQRLVEIVEESSFWTADLARHTANLLGIAFKVALFLSFVALYGAIYAGVTSNFSDAAGKILLAFATFYFASDTTQTERKYCDLAETSRRVAEQCGAVKTKFGSELLQEALILADEYNCALASAPVIPEMIYRWYRDRLNAAWVAKREPLSPNFNVGSQSVS
jgi:hypothetical protein